MHTVANGGTAEFAVDKRYLRADGSPVWVHSSVSPLLGEDGRPEGLIEIVEDITTRHLAEERMRESEARYRSLVDASTAIVWTADPEGAFQPPQESWEACTGQTPEQYRGWGWSERAASRRSRAYPTHVAGRTGDVDAGRYRGAHLERRH